MALSSRKRIAPLLPPSAITKRTRPCFEVSAQPVRTPEKVPLARFTADFDDL
jgi:hypothetical protein